MRRLALAALASTLLIAACGGDKDVVIRPRAGSGASADRDVVYPAEATTPVVVVQSFSFWISEPERWSRIPGLTIYGDGLVIAYADTDSNEAPLMLPALSVRRLDPDGMQIVLRRLRDAGLLGPLDLSSAAANEIYDSVTTSVTIRADGGMFRHDGYHLSSDRQYRTPERDRFVAVLDDLADLDALVGPEHLTDAAGAFPHHYLLRAREPDPARAEVSVDAQPWPLATVDLATAGECTTLDADEVGDAFDGVALATPFRAGDLIFEVALRPFTPGLNPC